MNKYNKGFSTPLAIIIALVAVGGIALLAINKNPSQSDVDAMMKDEGAMMETHSETMMKDDAGTMMKDENTMMMKDTDTMMEGAMMEKGGYREYAADQLSFAKSGHVVLFFHAPWCPTCRAADADITAKAGTIPSDVLILKTDYDTNTELKKKYGVTYQHTFVEVDENGTLIQKWSGGELDTILSKVQ